MNEQGILQVVSFVCLKPILPLLGSQRSKRACNRARISEAPGMENLTLHLHFSRLRANWRGDTLPAHSLGRKRQEPICRATQIWK